MGELIFGALLLIGAVYLLRGSGEAKPNAWVAALRRIGGIAVLTVGVLAMMRGQIAIGFASAVLGAGLAGWIHLPWLQRGPRLAVPNGRVRTPLLDIEIHPGTGAMRGAVIAGRFAGRSLASLQPAELVVLYRDSAADPRSRSVLEAYLDRRAPGWREHFQEDPAPGRAGRGGRSRHAMAQEEAYKVLGVQPGAGADQIRQAHRSLMKKVHPDQGGTADLAARVNEAKDVLLGSHPHNS